MTVYIKKWTKTCLAARDGDGGGGGGGEMGPLHGIMITIITHRAADCTDKDRTGTGLCRPMTTRMIHDSVMLTHQIRSGCWSRG